MDDIVKGLQKWLEKDQIVARNWNENGFSIDGDIELAIEEIKRLRELTKQPTEPLGPHCTGCNALLGNARWCCPKCGRANEKTIHKS